MGVVTRGGHLYCWPCLYRWLEPGMLPEEKEVLFASSREATSLRDASNLARGRVVVDNTRRCCPVCKAETSVSEIIPIYVRNNNEADDNNKKSFPITPTRSNCTRRKKRGNESRRNTTTLPAEEISNSYEQETNDPIPMRLSPLHLDQMPLQSCIAN